MKRQADVLRTAAGHPLQVGKFIAVTLTLVLGAVGFFRLLDAGAVLGNSPLADSQFLTLILLPLSSLVLVCVVVLETVVAVSRAFTSERSLGEQATERPGYLVVRGLEAGVAVAGLGLMLLLVPVLFADTTTAPAGVGALLGLLVVGVGIQLVSFARSLAELIYFGRSA